MKTLLSFIAALISIHYTFFGLVKKVGDLSFEQIRPYFFMSQWRCYKLITTIPIKAVMIFIV